MVKDSLWEKAFLFKKTKMWQHFQDSNLFAVEFENGERGYCGITGKLGQHTALIVYEGDKGLMSWRWIMNTYAMCESDALLVSMEQYCLQCSFETKDDTDPGQLEELKAYAKKNGIRPHVKPGYPNLLRYRPHRASWPVNEEEAVLLEEALEAALYLNELLAADRYSVQVFEKLGFFEDADQNIQTMPLMKKSGNGWEMSVLTVPYSVPFEYEVPQLPAKQKMDALKKKRGLKKNDLDVSLRVLPARIETPVGDDPADFLPMMVFATRRRDGLIVMPVMFRGDDEAAYEQGLSEFCENLTENKPRTIHTASERTAAFLEEFCDSAGIELSEDSYDPEHEAAFEEFFDHFQNPMSQLIDTGIIDQLMELDDDMFYALPEELIMLLSEEVILKNLPAKLQKRLIRMLS